MERITQKDLEILVDVINVETKNPTTSYTKHKDGANIGNFHLDYAYGGVKLAQITNTGGTIREISHDGFGTKRQLHSFMQAYLDGMAVAKS